MADESTKLEAVGNFIGKLTPRSLFLGVLAGFFAVGLSVLYESRVQAFIYIINSPTLLLGIAGGVVMVACGWIVSVSMKRLEEYLLTKIDDQAKTIDYLTVELKDCKDECRNGTSKMLSAILEKLNGS